MRGKWHVYSGTYITIFLVLLPSLKIPSYKFHHAIFRAPYHHYSCHIFLFDCLIRLCLLGWDFVTFNSNRPIGIRDRIFGVKSIRVELDFVLQVWVRSDPIGQSSQFSRHIFILFSCYIFKLFNYCLPRQCISRNFSRHIVNLFKHCLPCQFIYCHLIVPLFP